MPGWATAKRVPVSTSYNSILTPLPHSIFVFSLINFIGVYLIYNVVLVSAIQQSDSVIHVHISTLFKILFLHRSLEY